MGQEMYLPVMAKLVPFTKDAQIIALVGSLLNPVFRNGAIECSEIKRSAERHPTPRGRRERDLFPSLFR
jgi:hypothetical protein